MVELDEHRIFAKVRIGDRNINVKAYCVAELIDALKKAGLHFPFKFDEMDVECCECYHVEKYKGLIIIEDPTGRLVFRKSGLKPVGII